MAGSNKKSKKIQNNLSNKVKAWILVIVMIVLAVSFIFNDYLEQNANRVLGYEPAPTTLRGCDL